MSRAVQRALVVVAAILPPTLHAQVPRPSPAEVGCGAPDNRLLRSVMGGTAGAIVGLVAVNIRYSDWSDQRPSNVGAIRLNAGAIGGLLGASLGSIRSGGHCVGSRSTGARERGAYALITAEEITRSGITGSVYEVVYSLRRSWLNTRGIEVSETPQVHGDPRSGVVVTPGNPTIMVYLDNGNMGDMVALKAIAINGVAAVRYYDAAQATQKWGAGHNHGAIQVLTSSVTVAP